MRKKEFLRRESGRLRRVGKGRKKKQKWRKPKGGDNKMRLKEKGYPKVVSVGYKKPKKEVEIIKRINNQKELKNVKNGEKVILGRMGKKKKILIAETAKKNNIKIINLNVRGILRKLERAKKKKEKEDAEKIKTKKEKKAEEKSAEKEKIKEEDKK